MQYWISLVLSLVGGVLGLTFARKAYGFEHPKMVAVSLFFAITAYLLLTYALRGIPAVFATAIYYSVVLIGFTAVCGIYFKDSITVYNILFMGLIITGIVGLKLTS